MQSTSNQPQTKFINLKQTVYCCFWNIFKKYTKLKFSKWTHKNMRLKLYIYKPKRDIDKEWNNMVLIISFLNMICIKSCWKLDSTLCQLFQWKKKPKQTRMQSNMQLFVCATAAKQKEQLYQILTSTRFINYQKNTNDTVVAQCY